MFDDRGPRSHPHARSGPRPRRPLAAVVLVLAWLVLCAAPDLAAQPVRQLRTGFERDVSQYRWVADARFAQDLGRWNVTLANRFTSNAFILLGDRLSFRDENQLAWQVNRGLGERLDARVRGRTSWFAQSQVFNQEVYAAFRYRPLPYLAVEPAVGLAWDRRPGAALDVGPPPVRMDAGPAYGVGLDWSPPPVGGYRLHLEGESAWQVINPRRGRAIRLGGSAQRSFEGLQMAVDVGYTNYRRDAYQAASFLNRGSPTERRSETVEATTSDTLSARLQIDAPLLERLRLTSVLDVAMNNRFIRTLHAPANALFFDTDFHRRAIDLEIGAVYEAPGAMLRLAARGGAEVEDRRLTNRDQLPPTQVAQKGNLLQQANYDAGHLALHADARLMLGRAIFMANAASSILRRDTPASNLDDRDELHHRAELGARFTFNRYLLADVRLFGTYYHTVYLSAARSAENNIQRSLRLRPAVEWSPSPRTRIRLGSEIRATYTVDDFVLAGRRPTDQSARELRYDGFAEHDLGGGFRLLVSGSLSDLHLGRLFWERFAEIPSDTLRTYNGWIRLESRLAGGLVADVGLRLFIRSDYDRAATIRYPRLHDDGSPVLDESGTPLLASITRPGRQWIEQVGPTCALSVPLRNASTLRIDGWLNVQHVRQRLYGSLPEDQAERIRRAGRRGTRTIVPNVAMTVVWNL